MKIVITQSNYIPWRGWFDMVDVDALVLLDNVQYTRRDWRNRNKIIVNGKPHWLTIPVKYAPRDTLIEDILVDGNEWREGHFNYLYYNYRDTPHWKKYAEGLKALYDTPFTRLSEVNYRFILYIMGCLGMSTPVKFAHHWKTSTDKNQRLIDLCAIFGADTYRSGPAAYGYLQEHVFAEHGIKVEWMKYKYPDYPGMVNPRVSILDMLFHVGPDRKYWKSQ